MRRDFFIVVFIRTYRYGRDVARRVKSWKDRRSTFLKNFASIFTLMLILWIVNPMGAVTQSALVSAQVFYQIVAPEYGHEGKTIEDDTELPVPEIAVIMFNDETLRKFELGDEDKVVYFDDPGPDTAQDPPKTECTNQDVINKRIYIGDTSNLKPLTWPPSLAFHAHVLEKILRAHPKAVFVDFAFFDARDFENVSRLAETIRTYARSPEEFPRLSDLVLSGLSAHGAGSNGCSKPPVLLVGADSSAPETVAVIPGLAKAATALVSTRYVGDDPRTHNIYPLLDCGESMYSAALALYADWFMEQIPDRMWRIHEDWGGFTNLKCKLHRAEVPEDDSNTTSQSAQPAESENSDELRSDPPGLSIYWATWGSRENGRGDYKCNTLPETWHDRLWEIFQEKRFGLLLIGESRPPETVQSCPPFRTVTVQRFLDATGAMRTEFLKDKYVLYGGNFAMADDLIRPPTHDAIPGVFVHAMVLDNLFRGEVRVDGTQRTDVLAKLLTFVAIVVSSICSAAAWHGIGRITKFGHAKSAALPDRPAGTYRPQIMQVLTWAFSGVSLLSCLGILMLCVVASAFFACALMWFGFSTLMIPPINVVGIVSTVGLHSLGRGVLSIVNSIL